MAEHTIETRILLRYDTLENWMSSTVILKQGEAAVASTSSNYTIENTDYRPAHTPPAVGIKIGDGYHYFSELPWVQAAAGDVYSWAKAQAKPLYTADEIQGLAAFIENHGGGGGGGSGGSASTAYRIIYNTNTQKYILQYYDETTSDWVNTSSEIDLSTILNRITAIENWANGSYTDIGNITDPLVNYISDSISLSLGRLDVSDAAIQHQFVTSVSEENGRISVERSTIDASDITTGTLSTEQGGTGFTEVNTNEILKGSASGRIQKGTIASTIDDTSPNDIPTTGALISYVSQQTAGITGAMHFIGEASVVITENSRINPQISGYNFRLVKPGDVVLSEAKEFVWTGSSWRLLGDEGSYAIKGSIVDADISPDANIAQNKIANLTEDLSGKVDKIEGKGLSTNDYTREEKEKLEGIDYGAQANVIEHVFVNDVERPVITVNGQPKSITLSIDVFDEEHATKLDGIQAGAQVNAIEHIFVNGQERPIVTINNQSKSVNIQFNEYTDAEQQKLANIEDNAQENIIESITINGNTYTPNEDKEVNITIDPADLNLNVIEGAQVPNGNTTEEVPQLNKKLQFARMALTGNIQDLRQTAETYVILDCGSSTVVV